VDKFLLCPLIKSIVDNCHDTGQHQRSYY